MAYDLTLTQGEREAFDWVGNRYNAGKVCDLLCTCLKEDEEWSQEGDITFDIPEHVAWQINELAGEENHSWPCFDDELVDKLYDFCSSIV